MKTHSLYICYFGVRQPLVQTQVIPYLRELAKGGHRITLLTFEPAGEERGKDEETRQKLNAQGIDWRRLRYHKRFSALATAWDVFQGAWFIKRFISREKPDVLHGRVHIPTLMGAIARKFSRRKPKILFDIRGFFPEEYTDAGIWPENGLLYRAAKRVEKWLLKDADGFVVLTERAREILFPESLETGLDKQGRPVEVIPCCVDLARFEYVNGTTRTEMRERLGVRDRYVVAYVGAFGGWYLTDETANFFAALKSERPNAFAMVLTQSDPEAIEPLLKKGGLGPSDYLITKVLPAEIPNYLAGADVAVSFIKNCYSKQASSPTKNAEYLACGLPIVANEGIGDTDRQINGNQIGTLVRNFSTQDFIDAIREIDALGDAGERCRKFAAEQFDLQNVGGMRYRRIYERLLQQ